MTWANQVRLLTLNLQSLAAVLGQGIIAGILPAIQALNAFMSKLQAAANTFRNFMYVLMGKKLKGSTKGIVSDVSTITDTSTGLENLGTSGTDAADGVDDTTSSVKDLTKALSVLSFDELNQLTDNSSTSSGTSGSGTGTSGTGTDGTGTDLSDLTDSIDDALNSEETPINKWASKIRKAFLNHDWEGLGATIADMLNIGMQKIYDVINWNKVGKKITAFCDAFTRTFNSLVDNIDWALMGRTVGAGINTIVNTLNLLITGIDWKNLGNKFATGIQGLVTEVNWTNLGNAIGNAFMVAWDIFYGFVGNLPYANIGTSFANLLNGVFEKISFSDIATALTNGINGAFTTLESFTTSFDWNNLANNIVNGITNIISNFDWKGNGQKLEKFLDDLLETLLEVSGTINWTALGHNIGTFLSQIDWGEHLADLATVLLDVLGGIWEGLGTTSAGKFIQAIAVFQVGSELLPFVNSICNFFTGQTVTGKISSAIQGVLSPALTTAAESTIPVFGTSLASLVGTAGGITLAVVGAYNLAKGIASITEKMQGGNGITSQYGGYMHDYATELQNYANITNEEAEALWNLIETDEEKGLTHDEMYADMIEKLQEYGVSAEQAQEALETYGAQAGVSTEFVEGMTNAIGNLGDGMSEASNTFDTSKISLDDLKDEMYQLSLKSGDLQGVYQNLTSELNNSVQNGTYTNTADALDFVYTAIKNAGGSTDELNKKLAKDFPDAAQTVQKTVSTTISKSQQDISSSMGTAATDTANATSSMVNSATEDMNAISSVADSAMSKVSSSTSTNWGNSSREATLKAREMKLAVSTELSNMDESVRSHFTSQYNIAYKKWESLGSAISSFIKGTMSNDITNAISSLTSRITSSFSDMYSIGHNAMQQLANGMRNVSIQTPHMYMNMSTYGSGTSRSYSWNSGVNWYAKGGLFDNASVIGVGEAGQEAVLPLENKRTMSMIANSIIDNSDDSLGLSQDDIIAAVEQGVVNAFMNNASALQGNSPEYIMNSINIDGKAIAKAVSKAQEKQNYRMNPSVAY